VGALALSGDGTGNGPHLVGLVQRRRGMAA